MRTVHINASNLVKACMKLGPVRVIKCDGLKATIEVTAQQRQWLTLAGIKWLNAV